MAIRFVRESPEQKRHFQPTMLQIPQTWQLELQKAANSKENYRTAESPKKRETSIHKAFRTVTKVMAAVVRTPLSFGLDFAGVRPARRRRCGGRQ
jgi:hypothetical protein